MKIRLLQTIECRADQTGEKIVEKPIYSSHPEDWLGPGYYFWDTFEESAHWWGRIRYHKRGGGYVITETGMDLGPQVLDLVGNMYHLRIISELLLELHDQSGGIANISLGDALSLLMDTGGGFVAIRAEGVRESHQNDLDRLQEQGGVDQAEPERASVTWIRMESRDKKHPLGVNLRPKVQICVKEPGLSLLNPIKLPGTYLPK